MRGRTRKRFLSAFLALFALLLFIPSTAQADNLTINAGASILIEASTGKVLMGENLHTQLPMASTTKIMTALVALENAGIMDMVTVTSEAYGMEGSSIYLNLGEKISLKDLLYGLMLASGNDAAVAIAVHVGGSVEGFAQMMNERARSLGLVNTNFVTPNGLHDDAHYTSAYDLAYITAAAMENPFFREIVSTQYYRTQTGDTVRTFRNKNRTLSQYEGCCGVKTGYTKKAGTCLVFAAERDGMLLIGVLLNAPSRFDDAIAMLNYGFFNYEMCTLVEKFAVIAHVQVNKSKINTLDLLANSGIMVPVQIGESVQCQTQVVLREDFTAPIKAGEVCGTLYVLENGRRIASVALVAATDAEALDFLSYLRTLYSRWLA